MPLFRQSSTSRAPRERVAPARRSSGGPSSSHQGAFSLTPPARTQPQTAMGLTTARCHEFPHGATHALHAHTFKHTKRPQQARPKGGQIPTQFSRSVDINRAGSSSFYCSVHTLTCCTVVGSLTRFTLTHSNVQLVLHLTFRLFLCSLLAGTSKLA